MATSKEGQAKRTRAQMELNAIVEKLAAEHLRAGNKSKNIFANPIVAREANAADRGMQDKINEAVVEIAAKNPLVNTWELFGQLMDTSRADSELDVTQAYSSALQNLKEYDKAAEQLPIQQKMLKREIADLQRELAGPITNQDEIDAFRPSGWQDQAPPTAYNMSLKGKEKEKVEAEIKNKTDQLDDVKAEIANTSIRKSLVDAVVSTVSSNVLEAVSNGVKSRVEDAVAKKGKKKSNFLPKELQRLPKNIATMAGKAVYSGDSGLVDQLKELKEKEREIKARIEELNSELKGWVTNQDELDNYKYTRPTNPHWADDPAPVPEYGWPAPEETIEINKQISDLEKDLRAVKYATKEALAHRTELGRQYGLLKKKQIADSVKGAASMVYDKVRGKGGSLLGAAKSKKVDKAGASSESQMVVRPGEGPAKSTSSHKSKM
jgi:hypothetical protein